MRFGDEQAVVGPLGGNGQVGKIGILSHELCGVGGEEA